MADLFFYGTLCHLPLLERVLGRCSDQIDMTKAVLADYASYWVKDRNFPMIQEEADAQAAGLFVRGLSKADVAALNFYEGGFHYELKPVSVRLPDGSISAAEVYFPDPGLWTPGAKWDLSQWASATGDLVTEAATEVMAHHGQLDVQYVAQSTYPIMVRAASRLAHRARPPASDRDLSQDVIVHRHERAHLSFFSTEVMDLQFRRYDGTMSEVLNRTALMVGEAAVVLPYDPVRDEVLLIQQFRAPAFMAGEQDPWIWEPVAGLVDAGETPEITAQREAMEEAGVEVRHLEPVASSYPSTGNSGEFIHIFIGLSDLSHVTGGGGLASEHEDIRSEVISFETLMHRIDTQVYNDMPLVTAALWLARHRDRLQKT